MGLLGRRDRVNKSFICSLFICVVVPCPRSWPMQSVENPPFFVHALKCDESHINEVDAKKNLHFVTVLANTSGKWTPNASPWGFHEMMLSSATFAISLSMSWSLIDERFIMQLLITAPKLLIRIYLWLERTQSETSSNTNPDLAASEIVPRPHPFISSSFVN
jgi:hypothetical protein